MPTKKIAVIGSGFGGLSAAIRLAAKGHDVTIYEKRDQLGGRAYQYNVNGFKFDGGPTVITAPHMFDELFLLAGKRREDYMKLVPVDPFYRIFNEHHEPFNYYRDNKRAEAEIAKFSPGDVEGYRQFMKGVNEIFNWFHPFTEKSFPSFASFAKIFPHVLTSGTWRSMHGYAAQFVKDEFIRKICSFHPLLVGGNPFDTPSIYGLIMQFEKEWGIHYAMGGTGAIVEALGKLFSDLGGRVMLNTEIKEILIRNKKACGVRLLDGSTEWADEVVCNSDIAFTYNKLIPRSEIPASMKLWLNNLEYSNSLVVIYFGTKKRYPDSKLSHHNLILGKDYRNLMQDIFSKKKIGKEMGLYLHMPSRTDPTIAPAGCE
ncbi:MAG TPA: phytoene desaturase family protein, partial [Chitinophagaceae bacterium]|nr:phytoene desaturase family protein [Chitinophagaceae bacterium]